MRLEIEGLAELRARIQSLNAAEIASRALADEAERLAQTVRESLSEPPGAGDHDRPWARTGALRDSIAATSEGLEAAVGSNDPAAAPQEMGTAHIPPRPFLAPVAASNGEQVAQTIGARLAAALRGDAADPNIIPVSSTGMHTGAALLGALVAGGIYYGLKGSSPHPTGPTRPTPLMNETPPEDGSQREETAPTKPELRPNAAHDPRSPDRNPAKDPEPPDAAEVYENARPRGDGRVWYGQNSSGEWYQYRNDETGGTHYAGTVKPERVPIGIRRGK